MNIEQLQQELDAAKRRVKAQPPLGRDNLAQHVAAHEAVSQAQRALAAAKGDPHAIPLNFGFEPEAAVSAPLFIEGEHKAFLTFNASIRGSSPDRTSRAQLAVPIGIVEIEQCYLSRLGYPNDEGLDEHPLSEHGITAYGSFEVVNSQWIKDVASGVAGARHFIVTFHDSTFECIAKSAKGYLGEAPFAECIRTLSASAVGD
jgi:hypothetical protein